MLAVLDSEPVTKVEAVGVCWYADNGLPRKPAVGTELFSTPSAPVCIPTFEEWCERTEQKPVGWVRDAMKEAYDACLSTMLGLLLFAHAPAATVRCAGHVRCMLAALR